MANIGIFFGSSTGNTEFIAEKIQTLFGENMAEIHNVDAAGTEDVEKYKYLIIGTSTWGIGDMQDDMEDFIDILTEANLDKKKVALFGLGDQDTYPDSFADGVGGLYETLSKKTKVVGEWPTTGYTFTDSDAVKDGKFVGLVLDQDNQAGKTDERLSKWVEGLKKEFS